MTQSERRDSCSPTCRTSPSATTQRGRRSGGSVRSRTGQSTSTNTEGWLKREFIDPVLRVRGFSVADLYPSNLLALGAPGGSRTRPPQDGPSSAPAATATEAFGLTRAG